MVLKAIIDFASKVMDGKKTKAGVAIALAGGSLPSLALFGVDITPDAVINAVNQILGLFGYHIVGDVQQVAQTFLGNVLTLVGSGIALYGYARKGELIAK